MDHFADLLARCEGEVSQAEQLEWVRQWQNFQSTGEERETCVLKLALANWKYIAKLGSRYRSLTDESLLSAGIEGMVEALERFDCTSECTFLTFAHYRILRSIRLAANEYRPIRIPGWAVDKIGKLNKARAEIKRRTTISVPTVEELASETGFSTETIVSLMDAEAPVLPLDAPIDGETDGYSHLENIVDPGQSVDDAVFERAEMSQLIQALERARLTEFEQDVLIYRYGLWGVPKLSLKETGKKLGRSREGIRAVQLRAVRKLREYFQFYFGLG